LNAVPDEHHATSATPGQAPARSWFKGNLHTHTLWSDGDDYPEMVADWYRRHGYHFLALTDHNLLSQGARWRQVPDGPRGEGPEGLARYRERFGKEWVETRAVEGKLEVRLKALNEFRGLLEQPDRFLLIQGEEITAHFGPKPVHLNGTNLVDAVAPHKGENVIGTIRANVAAVEDQSRRTGRPMLVHVNHPNFFHAITAEDLAAATEARYVEIYNGHPLVHHRGDWFHAGVERIWDIANTLRIAERHVPPLAGLAADDAHHYGVGHFGAAPGRGWIMVRATRLTPEALVQAIRDGDFYASTGVTLRDLRYTAEPRSLALEIEPESDARYVIHFIGTRSGFDRTHRPVRDPHGKPLPVTQRYSTDVGQIFATIEGTRARYTFTGDELYVRAVVTSSKPHPNPSFPGQARRAWTQPVGWERWVK
jgi:hypothetical protein